MEDSPALDLVHQALDIYTAQYLQDETGIPRETLSRLKKSTDRDGAEALMSMKSYRALQALIPRYVERETSFDFIDLFAGIGGIRKGFEDVGGRCVFTSEWDQYSIKTYKANYAEHPDHRFVADLKTVTQPPGLSDHEILTHIRNEIPHHDVLLAGFPCQPFSLAGVSKKNSLGRSHGFECEDQGQLFFDVIRVMKARRPPFVVLENVKNLRSHDKGNTFKVIRSELKKAGYWVANAEDSKPDPKVIDAAHFVPQHRERIVLLCVADEVAKAIEATDTLDLKNIQNYYPKNRATLLDILDKNEDVDRKYTLTPLLWEYLQDYSAKHKAKGNGFGYGKVTHSRTETARTLSARYHKDGSEILIDQANMARDSVRQGRPRRLTPQECARLMGFTKKGEDSFRIPVSDTQAYRQFGNSVVVPVFRAIAEMLTPYIAAYKALDDQVTKVA